MNLWYARCRAQHFQGFPKPLTICIHSKYTVTGTKDTWNWLRGKITAILFASYECWFIEFMISFSDWIGNFQSFVMDCHHERQKIANYRWCQTGLVLKRTHISNFDKIAYWYSEQEKGISFNRYFSLHPYKLIFKSWRKTITDRNILLETYAPLTASKFDSDFFHT